MTKNMNASKSWVHAILSMKSPSQFKITCWSSWDLILLNALKKKSVRIIWGWIKKQDQKASVEKTASRKQTAQTHIPIKKTNDQILPFQPLNQSHPFSFPKPTRTRTQYNTTITFFFQAPNFSTPPTPHPISSPQNKRERHVPQKSETRSKPRVFQPPQSVSKSCHHKPY